MPSTFIEEERQLRLFQNGTALIEIRNPIMESGLDETKKVLRYKCDFQMDKIKIALNNLRDLSEKTSTEKLASQEEADRSRVELAASKASQEQQRQTTVNDTELATWSSSPSIQNRKEAEKALRLAAEQKRVEAEKALQLAAEQKRVEAEKALQLAAEQKRKEAEKAPDWQLKKACAD